MPWPPPPDCPSGPLWLLRGPEGPPEPKPHPCFSAALAPQTHWHSQPGGARAHYADALRGAARCNYKPAASVRLALAVDGNRHCRHSCQHHASASPSAAIFALFYHYPLFRFFLFISACFLLIPSCVSPQSQPSQSQSPRFNLLLSFSPCQSRASLLLCWLVVWLRHLVGGPHLGWLTCPRQERRQVSFQLSQPSSETLKLAWPPLTYCNRA